MPSTDKTVKVLSVAFDANKLKNITHKICKYAYSGHLTPFKPF